ncbi:MAG: hypothetical protein OXI15_06690, partial [Chromatiales bacterium]|nr:hypothetical protein [Chromatiales bacterium]
GIAGDGTRAFHGDGSGAIGIAGDGIRAFTGDGSAAVGFGGDGIRALHGNGSGNGRPRAGGPAGVGRGGFRRAGVPLRCNADPRER